MPTSAGDQKSLTPPSATSRPDRYPQPVRLLAEVKQGLKKIGDNPRSYRSSAFREWHKQAQTLYQSAAWFGAPPIIEETFSQRGFGRSRDLLNDAQIFALFKQDVQITMKELDYFIACYRRMNKPEQPQTSAASAELLPPIPVARLSKLWLVSGLGLLAVMFLVGWLFKAGIVTA
ncbi:hypothetical protein [Halioxenophilus sp. WMMB6]|uniref:hypothetical protein n=1 Tax=Halioxenophilus sp. WMMB6 TaxID=3073815 RepID=UPI00295E646F|nr:hypothetical protein [Halioxenophilus sp. WMMB6]